MKCNGKNGHIRAEKEKILIARCTCCINKYNDWGTWANISSSKLDSNGRKEAILKSQRTRAIEEINWVDWVDTNEATADDRKYRILKSGCSASIGQLTD